MELNNVDWARQEEEDERAMQALLDNQNQLDQPQINLNMSGDLGEKADDAIDFEDMSDDDLPEEEEATNGASGGLPGLTDDAGTSNDADDDLFGDMGDFRGSSPFGEDEVLEANDTGLPMPKLNESSTSANASGSFLPMPSSVPTPVDSEPKEDLRALNFPEPEPSDEQNQDLTIPDVAQNHEELIRQIFPDFVKGPIMDWGAMLPNKKAYYIPKQPLRPPKQLNPTKVSLELAQDQEKSFRTAGPAHQSKESMIQSYSARGLIPILDEESDEAATDEELDWNEPAPDDMVGGVSWADLQVICDDWDSKIEAAAAAAEVEQNVEPVIAQADDDMEWLREMGMELGGDRAKRQKIGNEEDIDILGQPTFAVPSFDDFERITAQTAKKVVLDLNDPFLLVDIQQPSQSNKRLLNGTFKHGGTGNLSKSLTQRFNISNDEAYEALKENHQNKVRALIGNITVEHSLPALKLQWPYYKVKLHTRDARSYHRPQLQFKKMLNHVVYFSRSSQRKKKHLKGLSTQEIFAESKDLSLGDNSTAMLLEYSEEHPTVLSNFGMGSRIINYYRRRDHDDQSRPKNEIGETSVLMPEDRSPFAQFGTVDPGEIVPTLHNAMYRAPVFKHDRKDTDFLVIRSTTGVGGPCWHLRNIDHIYAVGQQLPSMEIPGPQSRKVTNASKNRMKMIAFRKIRHHPMNTVKIEEITAHIADSSDMQNRQKLKEFIKYYKDEKVWRAKPGELIPDEATVRSWVKPEDICVIDAMQVGLRHLEDAGYGRDNGGDESDEEREGDSLEQQLAPWKTSKNFLDATTGKAMLQLHGEGDPSGHGLAFSFIKTSMKGGYLDTIQGPQATTEDAIARERKANGGHKYNVDKQNEIYSRAIKEIWERQRQSLMTKEIPDIDEMDLDHPLEKEDQGAGGYGQQAPTPANFIDDSVSQVSRFSRASQKNNVFAHRIIRTKEDKKTGMMIEEEEIVTDPRVWREYMKRRHALDADRQNIYDVKPTGDPEWDRKEAQRFVTDLISMLIHILTCYLASRRSLLVSSATRSVVTHARSRRASSRPILRSTVNLQHQALHPWTRYQRAPPASAPTVVRPDTSRRTRSCAQCSTERSRTITMALTTALVQ